MPNDVITDLSALVAAGSTFGTIYADPPWRYDNRASRGAAHNHYDTMEVAEIRAMPVRELAEADAHLHLWTTNAFLFDAPRIFDAWGFEFRSTFVWCKPQMGVGNYWRNSHEIMLTATRGNPPPFATDEPGYIICPRSRHSAKPERVRHMIERACPGPYLELFGRRAIPGWTVFGNQIARDLLSPAA